MTLTIGGANSGQRYTCLAIIWLTIITMTTTTVVGGSDTMDSSQVSELSACINSDGQKRCDHLSYDCLNCRFNYSCEYGHNVTTECRPTDNVHCSGDNNFSVSHLCAFCYQLPEDRYECTTNSSCNYNYQYKAVCHARPHVLCLGKRSFQKYRKCNFVSGYKWSTALLLSVTLGGFGIDRFYLGLWQEGVGKLFSFGGLGVWTLIDVILIATGYLKPSDGSVYI
ncbi:TM2 domain-containing protein 3-like [Oppia nitens]|uniref:TM2 domain-containing protein 3-like n=1 Tax=Oppia nitens TaxID=1686743 RepID=UPI0023DC52B3|nr:TM2 domain-containing protein 3-like [Oppia nitens]